MPPAARARHDGRMRTRIGRLVAVVAVTVAVTLAGCSRSDDAPATTAATSSAPTQARPSSPAAPAEPATAPLVLAISVDGLNPEAIDLLGPRGAPNLHRLVREGASTMNARTAYELTITLPNHTGMLTGRGVAGRSGHGVYVNDDLGGTLASTHGSYVPGVFDVVHDHGLGTAFFAEKEKFGFLMRSWDADNGARDVTGPDDGRDKTDVDRIDDAAALIPQVGKALADADTGLVFLHLAAVDRAGHEDGWLGASYLAAVQSVDRDLGTLLDVIESSPRLHERVTILLTADHGGARGATSHDDAANRADYRVPFIAWGRGVTRGADLYALTAGRADPGDGRPDYSGPQPVRNIDVADTALSLLELPPVAAAVSSRWPRLRLE